MQFLYFSENVKALNFREMMIILENLNFSDILFILALVYLKLNVHMKKPWIMGEISFVNTLH